MVGDIMWNDKKYHTFNYEMKEIFGEKAIKLSIDGDFTCPNRDGKISYNGCIFCSERGSGDFTSDKTKTISQQIEEQKEIMSKKWKSKTYIAYFQNYTNTYDTVENLRIKFSSALNCRNICGLAIATRPDCVDKSVVDLLKDLNSKTFLWVELGLQTIHDKTSQFLRRGYNLDTFNKTVKILQENNIRVVPHLILGLPNENKNMMIESAKHISNLGVWGVKFHMLHILKNTDLHNFYFNNPFKILSLDEYVDIVCDCLESINSNIIVHRITGDGKKADLIEPIWTLNKLYVLSQIDKEMKKRDTFQGKNYFT